jgi:hypothetical protein
MIQADTVIACIASEEHSGCALFLHTLNGPSEPVLRLVVRFETNDYAVQVTPVVVASAGESFRMGSVISCTSEVIARHAHN